MQNAEWGIGMIRKIEEKDREIFYKFTKSFYSSPVVMSDIPDGFHKDFFDEILKSDIYADAFMIEFENKPVGYAVTAKTYSHEAGGFVIWLEELYIEEEYRGKGLGKEFFSFLESYYPNTSRFRLEAEEDNKKALKLYESLGYKRLEYIQLYKGR